jgi:carboxymethylenebutenolidase
MGGSTISFPRTTGKPAQGYLAEAGRVAAPAVVVIQEWWGVQGQIRSVCDRFAAEGFDALAPDLFEGKVIPYHDMAAASAALRSLDFEAATDQIVRGAVQLLSSRGAKVGIAGFCMGGTIANIAAVRVPELAAAVSFYGLAPEQVAAPKDVRVPLQGHFANLDDHWTPALVDEFEKKLQAAGKTFEIHRYEARHAFMNSDRKNVYDEAAAKVAWERCVQFLRRHLA